MTPKTEKILMIVLLGLVLLLGSVLGYKIYKKFTPEQLVRVEPEFTTKVVEYKNPYVKKRMFDSELDLGLIVEVMMIKDSDRDGLPDESEKILGRNPDVKDFINFGLDTDIDSLVDIEEEKIGTDPKNQDTDGDELTDWAELVIYGTDPLKQDTDGNGLIDSQEPTVLSIQSQIKNMRDSDRDGLVDGKEQELGTDPHKRDTDGDGLLDGPEVILGKDPLSFDYNPSELDTDGDGLTDSDEARLGTNFQNRDSDGDGLLDYEEVVLYQSDPNKVDTDGDGYNDGTEVKNGYDPNGPGKLPELPNYIRFTS